MATESDKINVGAIATLVAVGAIGLVAIVGALTALVRQELAADQERKGGAVNTRPYRDLQAAQLAELTEEAKWLDKEKGVLSIPVDRSMELVVEELRRDPETATPPAPADAGSDAAAADAGVPADAATQDAASGSQDSGPSEGPTGAASDAGPRSPREKAQPAVASAPSATAPLAPSGAAPPAAPAP